MSSKPDFSKVRLKPGELSIIREAYAETYPVRTLLNHVDELREALRYMHNAHHKQPCVCWIQDLVKQSARTSKAEDA